MIYDVLSVICLIGIIVSFLIFCINENVREVKEDVEARARRILVETKEIPVKNHSIISILLIIIFCSCLLGFALFSCASNIIAEQTKWNNGCCSCGGHYKFQQVIGHKDDSDYFYRCNKCGKGLTMNTFYNDKSIKD